MGVPTEQEFRDLYRNNEKLLLNYLMLLTSDVELAQDLMQETFMRFIAYRRRGKKVERPSAFLCRIATLLVKNHWKKQKRREGISRVLQQGPDVGKPVSDELLSVYQALGAIWSRLGFEERLIAKLIAIDEMNQGEISRFTGMSRATVQRRIKRINKLAKKCLE